MRKHKKAITAVAALVIGLAYVLGLFNHTANSTSIIDSAAKKLGISSKASAAVKSNGFKPTMVSDLNQVINNNTDPDNVEVAVSIIDLDNNKQYNAGEDGVVFKAASTAKLVAIVTYLHEVEIGNATLNQQIDGTSAQQLIKQMLEVSDNNAWASINDYLGNEQAEYAQSIGLTTFTGGDYNTISAADEAKLLALIYNDKVINNAHKQLMYSYMRVADGTDLIKAALPSTATVYHKYGMLWGNLHDTAIINYKGHNFALVIYTKNDDNGLDDYDARVALIHQLTQTVVSDMK